VWRDWRPLRCTIVAGERSENLEAMLVAIANSDQYGNNARIAPGARVDDGRLDLVAIRPVGFLGSLALVPRLFLGSLDRSPHVLRLSAPRFTIDRVAPGLVHTDGETHAAGARIEVVVRPRSLRIVVPALSRAVAPVAPAGAPRFALNFP
jgi:diacylglycerol kinase family enzyme